MEMSFGGLLRTHRRAAGLTQEQLAERAGYSTVYVSMLERGQRLPLPATALTFADALALVPRDRLALMRAVQQPGAGVPDEGIRQSDMTGERSLGELVGREREVGLIQRHLEGTGPPVLLLAGDPGIGKTRLLREAALRAGDLGIRALEGGCLRRGGQEPFAPVLQALQSALRGRNETLLGEVLRGCAWLVRLLPELAEYPWMDPLPSWSIPPDQERRLMDAAVVRLLDNVAVAAGKPGSGSGTLLVLDDLQWAGTDALDLIRVLVSAGARILGAYRENEIGSHHPLGTLLAALAHGGLVTRLKVGPLSDRDAAALLQQMLPQDAGDVDGELRERFLRRADGVPFFVVSCAHALRMGAVGEGQTEEIPWDVTQSIRQRVSVLPEPTRDLLGGAAVAGRRVPRWLLLAVAGDREDIALEGLDGACRARLLAETEDDGYQFVHDVIREAVEADLGVARRRALHRRIAEALERRGGLDARARLGAVEALAYHYVRSGDGAKAAQFLEAAGDAAAAQHANATAEGYYRELADRLDGMGNDAEAARAREKLGGILTTVARYDDALNVLDQAAREYRRLGDVEGEARATAHVGRVHSRRGTAGEGIARLEALRERLEGEPELRPPDGGSQALAALNAAIAPLFLSRGRYREQLDAAERAAQIARALNDKRLLAEAEVWRGCALNQLGKLEDGRRTLDDAIPLAEAANDLTSLVHALNDMGFLAEIGGDFSRSRTYRQRGLEVAEQVGDPSAIANMQFRCGQNAYLRGDWTAARDYFERSAATARRIDAPAILGYPLFGLGLLALARGDGNEVNRLGDECLAIAEQTADDQIRAAGQALLAERELQEDRPEAARARLRALARENGRLGLDLHSTLPTLAEACLAVGEMREAEACIDEGVQKAATSHSRVDDVMLARVRALAMMRWEDLAGAAVVLGEAIALARAMSYPLAEARLLTTRALLRKHAGDVEAAREDLDAAVTLFERLGATWYVRLATAEVW
jgi:tetratricopeptide (TPR) repeat protein/transcriptional regulator with XRE-family HTH domain